MSERIIHVQRAIYGGTRVLELTNVLYGDPKWKTQRKLEIELKKKLGKTQKDLLFGCWKGVVQQNWWGIQRFL